ncbi:MAG: CBS domain-containing protein [Deltaproteobacteria bacterium]|nr:CBS domain-containing protein [Deltaproteobacteria bacterium]
MICPSCGHKNIPGDDFCENCNESLMSLDGISSPKTEIGRSLMEDPIKKLSPKKPIAISEKESLLNAVEKMKQSKIGCLLITEGNFLKGILSERDLLFKVLGKVTLSSPVSQVMTPDPESLRETDSIATALNKMSLGGFRHIPILKEGRPSGIISIRDILQYISHHLGTS